MLSLNSLVEPCWARCLTWETGMRAIIRSSHHGHWRAPHAYRTAGERASNILFWTVIAATLAAAIAYTVYLFTV
jgi:hypothetical protein